jgi:hypothetical protein
MRDEMNDAVDVAILQAMVGRLDDYLTRNRLHLPLAVETPRGLEHPTMSIGVMLTLQAHLQASADSLTFVQRSLLDRSRSEMDRARRWYADSYRAHVEQEMRGLLHSWRWFLHESQLDPEVGHDSYVADVRMRTTIQLLIDDLGEGEAPAEIMAELEALDHTLGLRFQSGEFIWEPRLATVFPEDRYWWLYGRPFAPRQPSF